MVFGLLTWRYLEWLGIVADNEEPIAYQKQRARTVFGAHKQVQAHVSIYPVDLAGVVLGRQG
jgi:hypothetical protein